jgi:hypothetical protein
VLKGAIRHVADTSHVERNTAFIVDRSSCFGAGSHQAFKNTTPSGSGCSTTSTSFVQGSEQQCGSPASIPCGLCALLSHATGRNPKRQCCWQVEDLKLKLVAFVPEQLRTWPRPCRSTHLVLSTDL